MDVTLDGGEQHNFRSFFVMERSCCDGVVEWGARVGQELGTDAVQDVGIPAGADHSRPVLFIVDRTIDLVAPVQHGWTYQSLIYDNMRTRFNVVATSDATIVLDPERDTFWKDYALAFFPVVCQHVQKWLDPLLKQIGDSEKRIELLKSADSSAPYVSRDPVCSMWMMVSKWVTRWCCVVFVVSSWPVVRLCRVSQGVLDAVEALPEMTSKKKLLEQHMKLSSELMQEVTSRGLDRFYLLEEEMLAGEEGDVETVMWSFLESKARNEDKVRLAIVIYVWAMEQARKRGPFASHSADLYSRIVGVLKEQQVDTSALAYFAAVVYNGDIPRTELEVGGVDDAGGGVGGLMDRLSEWKTALKKEITGVSTRLKKRLGGGGYIYPLTKLVTTTLLTMKRGGALPDKLGLAAANGAIDVALESNVGGSGALPVRVMVVVVGGGAMCEYANMAEEVCRLYGLQTRVKDTRESDAASQGDDDDGLLPTRPPNDPLVYAASGIDDPQVVLDQMSRMQRE